MAQPRRLGAENAQNRVRFVDAAQQVLVEAGSHGLTARLVADRAGLKTQLLFYYFRSMDDLLRAVVQRVNARRTARFEAALAAPEPLRALWEVMSDPSAAALATELSAIAIHREAVREEIVGSARDFRIAQTRAVAALLPGTPLGATACSPAALVMIAASLARTLVTETTLGFTEGHDEALAFVESVLSDRPPG